MKILAQQLKTVAKTLCGYSAKVIFAGNRAYAIGDTITIVLGLCFDLGTFAVDAQKFKEVVGRFDGEVDVEVGNLLKLKHKRSKIELPVEKDVFVPKIAGLAGAGQLFNTKGLMDMLSFVQQASERKDMYSYAGVVSVMSRSGHLTAVATDGKRVAIASGSPCSEFIPLLVPVPVLAVLKALAPLSASGIAISEDQANIYFQCGEALVVARRLAQPFPNWESIIPKTFNLKISVKGADMKQCLGDVKAVIDPETQRLNVTIGSEHCELAVDGGAGSARTYCPVTPAESDLFDEVLDYKLVLNHSFLADFFDACEGDVLIGVTGESLPLYLESNNKKLIMLTQKGD